MKKVKHIVVKDGREFERQVNHFLSNHEGSRVVGYSSAVLEETSIRYEEHVYSALIEYQD